MLAVLLTLSALFLQGVPLAPSQGGGVTGMIRTAAGTPAVGVRVMALAQPEALKDLAAASSFAGLGETDASGRYRLENIPPGRYYIIAGRVDSPTFYPGTVLAAQGTVVSVSSGATVSSIDFVLSNASVGRAENSFARFAASILSLPPTPSYISAINLRIEGGGKVPIFADGRFPVIRFSRTGGPQVDVPWTALNVTLAHPDYRASIENVPPGYRMKSAITGPVSNLRLTLTYDPPRPPSGVRVTGRMLQDPNRSIYMSGQSGTIYADGTFEFLGVPPGQHAIVTLDNPGSWRPLGAAVVVGDSDLADVSLEEISVAPANSNSPPPTPARNQAAGSRIALSAIRGRIVDAETRAPFDAGKAYLNGDYTVGFALDESGQFEVPKLLPGRYELELFVFGVGSVKETVVIDGADKVLNLSIGP
jgi:hypothetical protein